MTAIAFAQDLERSPAGEIVRVVPGDRRVRVIQLDEVAGARFELVDDLVGVGADPVLDLQ